MKRQSKFIAALAAALLIFTLLACDAGPDGSCRGPACYSQEGHNP